MAGFTNVTADARITTHHAVLHGVIVLASSAGGDVSIYAGQDTGGQKIGTFKGAANVSNPIAFDPPLDCPSGIYVDVGSNITEVTIHWSPKD